MLALAHHNSNQNSNNKCNSASDRYSNPHSNIYCNPCVMYTDTHRQMQLILYDIIYTSVNTFTPIEKCVVIAQVEKLLIRQKVQQLQIVKDVIAH